MGCSLVPHMDQRITVSSFPLRSRCPQLWSSLATEEIVQNHPLCGSALDAQANAWETTIKDRHALGHAALKEDHKVASVMLNVKEQMSEQRKRGFELLRRFVMSLVVEAYEAATGEDVKPFMEHIEAGVSDESDILGTLTVCCMQVVALNAKLLWHSLMQPDPVVGISPCSLISTKI